MDTWKLVDNINRILDAHRRGKRNDPTTRETLRRLHDGLDGDGQQQFFTRLQAVILEELVKERSPAASPQQAPDTLGLVIHTISEFGPLEPVYSLLFSHLAGLAPAVVQNWVTTVSPIMVMCLHLYASRFRPGFLTQLKGLCDQYTSLYSDVPPDLVQSLKNIEAAIEEVEYRAFESTLPPATSPDPRVAMSPTVGFGSLDDPFSPPTLPLASAQKRGTPAQDFSFVKNQEIRGVLERDYAELITLDAASTPKAVLILAGAVLEGLLMDALLVVGKRNFENFANANTRFLSDMIAPAKAEGIIREDRLTDAVRKYRALAHPAREIRDKVLFTSDDAKLARSAVEVVIREVRQWHNENDDRTKAAKP